MIRIAGEPRVLQVVLSLNPGGTEKLVMALADRLHADLPTVVCCLDEPGAWADELRERGIAVHALGRQPGFQPALGLALARIATDHRATVVHAHHYSPFVYSCLARARRPSLRVVFTEHGRLSDAPPSAKRRLANRVLSRVPHAVYAVSDNLRQHIVAEGFSPDSVGVIYNGIDIGPLPDAGARVRIRAVLGADDDVFVVGTIARLDPVKDLGTLIAAVAALADRQRVLLAIVGDGPERAALETVVDTLGVGAQVRFLGQRDDARDWLAGCDIYVNSSVTEGVSLTILEAMAAGLPIVATRVGGTPEVVEEGWGRLIPARNPEALRAALEDLSQNPDLRILLGGAARRCAEDRFRLGRMIGAYREVYVRLSQG
jgi:glycosyltransferase involved in cell wall biosynthesis